MTKKFNIAEYDVVFISYDEPNAEENWAELLTIVPWAQRVHGVEGSDAAHKAAANLSTTDRFITIDGDNFVISDFTDQEIELDDEFDDSRCVFSWPSLNTLNGLMYGNGGIKCWPKQLVLDMKTHESADPDNAKAQVDFCWDITYVPIDKCFAEIHNNATPLQSWRAGFREGVKMSLEQGEKLSSLKKIWKSNLNRLIIWMMVGVDQPNGIWALYGARLGCYMTYFTDWDFVNVRDFTYLNKFWDEHVKHLTEEDLYSEIERITKIIGPQLGIAEPLTEGQSIFFKQFDFNPDRQPKTVISTKKKYDIVMITYDELNAEENWNELQSRYPSAKRVDKVKGIHAAHQVAASLVDTEMFWVVDGDAKVVDTFKFEFTTKDTDTVHVWRSKNPINDLEYGYGGIKLLPTVQTANMDLSRPDMTTSISNKYKPVFEVSNITAFNTDEFSAWRSGFRECCKLSSKVIDRQKNDETNKRLDIWCTVGSDRPFGQYAIDGAIAGRKYGTENQGNIDALKQINDFSWLKQQFIKAYNE